MMTGRLPILLLLPSAGSTPAEHWMADVRQAAAADLCSCLHDSGNGIQVHFAGARSEDRQVLHRLGAVPFDPPAGPFHFGRALAAFARQVGHGPFGYFGGASAPLMTPAGLRRALELAEGPGPTLVANNLHSTDWFLTNDAQALLPVLPALATDNPIGWQAREQGLLEVLPLPASASTLADLDTPADAALMHAHPDLGPRMKQALAAAPPAMLERVKALRAVLGERARTVAVIGRSSSHLWGELERQGRLWTRMYVEERGMLANGRAERGEVRSLVGFVLEAMGETWFVERLAEMADAALWDVRVWMAHRRAWPSDSDRFASDLGWEAQVADGDLRRLTAAVNEASIPIVCGGHGVVAGSALALLESL